MAHFHVLTGADDLRAQPVVRRIDLADLKDALARGIDDFTAIPSHAVFLCLIYPILGILLGWLTFGYGLVSLLYPMVAGFALLGPFAAMGLYELSRQRENGLCVNLTSAFDVLQSRSFGAIATLGLLLMMIFLMWLAAAQAIYIANIGYAPLSSVGEFAYRVFTTSEGWRLIVVGNGVGFLFALLVLAISVVSFPLLLDRDLGVVEAVLTSVRAVRANPVTMAIWGLFVATALLLGFLLCLVGLTVVLPVLGHSTWHLYRRVVEPNSSLRKEPPRPSTTRRRYAAQFPACLFAGEDRKYKAPELSGICGQRRKSTGWSGIVDRLLLYPHVPYSKEGAERVRDKTLVS